MKFLKNLFDHNSKSSQKTLATTSAIISANLKYSIPEPTRSLLWVTDENPEKAISPFTINILPTFTEHGVEIEIDKDKGNILEEPSLIWTKLPVMPNDELETEPMYYSVYHMLSPKHRYQYLMWLQDVTKPTNLSYVFLYYYGLERHLLIGDYDKARDEIIRLIKYHDQNKFRFYVIAPLIAASLYRKKLDILEKAPFLLKEVTNEALALRAAHRTPLIAKDVINLAYEVGFKNKRYILNSYERFLTILQKIINNFEQHNGSIWDWIDFTKLEESKQRVFLNISIPEKFRETNVPQILANDRFKNLLKLFLEETHNDLKEEKRRSRRKTRR